MSGNSEEIEWYLARDGQQFGPLSDPELKKVIDLGHLKPDDLLWRAGMDEWEVSDNIFPQSVNAKDKKSKAKAKPREDFKAKSATTSKAGAAKDKPEHGDKNGTIGQDRAAAKSDETPAKPAKPIYRAELDPQAASTAKSSTTERAKVKSGDASGAGQTALERDKKRTAPSKTPDDAKAAVTRADKPSSHRGTRSEDLPGKAQSIQSRRRALQQTNERKKQQERDRQPVKSLSNKEAAAKGSDENLSKHKAGHTRSVTGAVISKKGPNKGRRRSASDTDSQTQSTAPLHNTNHARNVRPQRSGQSASTAHESRQWAPTRQSGKNSGERMPAARGRAATDPALARRDDSRQATPGGPAGRMPPGAAQRPQGQPAHQQRALQHPSNPAAPPSPVLGSVAQRQTKGIPTAPSELRAAPGYSPAAAPMNRIAQPKRKSWRIVVPIILLSAIGVAGWLAYSGNADLYKMLGQYYSKAVSTGKTLAATYIPGAADAGAAASGTDTSDTGSPPKAVQVALQPSATAPTDPAIPAAPTSTSTSTPVQLNQQSPSKPVITTSMAPAQETSQDTQPGNAQGAKQIPTAPLAAPNPLQSSQLWRYIQQEFPDWYTKRANEAITLQEENLGDHAIVRLMDQKMIALRRQYATTALAASQQHLKAIASSFLTMVQVLSKHSTTACYGFISHGESEPEVAQLMQDQTFSRHLDAQSLAIVQAVVNGKNAPQTHKPPEPEDYRALATELTSRGWTKNDLQLFTDPVALSNAKPAKVCSMVQDWFSAQLALPDSAAQLRLLVQSLRPVIAG